MEKDKVYLKHILDAILAIETYAGDFSKEEFLEDELVQDAVIRQLEIIGEASKNLSSDFKKKHQNVAWKEVAGMRDKLIHDYFGVDLEIVWETIKQDLPFLKIAIVKIINLGGFKMNTKNAFSTLLTVLITAVVVGVLTGVISYSYAISKKDLEIEDLKEQLSQAKEGTVAVDEIITSPSTPFIPSTPSSVTADETTNWKTYTNDKYGFSFKYPGDWIEDTNIDSAMVRKENTSEPLFKVAYPKFVGDFENGKKISSEQVKINNKDYTLEKYRFLSGGLYDKETPYIKYFINTDKNVDLLFTFIEKDQINSDKVFDQILSTFQFTK